VSSVNDFLYGAIVTLCVVAAIYFWRFQSQTRDRFFGLFAAAFGMLGLNFIFLAAGDRQSEFRPYLYLIRLVAFLLIIAAIIDKNRGAGDSR
jgi:prolipoprotein diacylglyceryltransferase